jgi:uncharacterized protein with HEPN domain
MQGLSFSCDECVNEIKKNFPNFKYQYATDFRNEIALGWPDDLDDKEARKDWGWNPICKDLPSLTKEMLANIKLNNNN